MERKEIINKIIEEHRKSMINIHNASALCVCHDGTFPTDPLKRAGEIRAKMFAHVVEEKR